MSLYASIGDKIDGDDLSNQYIVNVILKDNENDVYEFKIADGVIIIVDSSQSINDKMQTLIQNSIMEKLKIILFINNIDVNLLTVSVANLDLIYRDLEQTIDAIQTIIHQYSDDELYSLDVMKNIVFGCTNTKECWAFSLQSFADIYSKSFSKFDPREFVKKLWGDHYYSFAVCSNVILIKTT